MPWAMDEPSALEIGYWIASAHCGHGYATEATAALTSAAFDIPGVDLVQIRCDPMNTVSAAIPRRLGFTHLETMHADTLTPSGAARDTMVWQMLRGQFTRAGV
jgi:RimJ/RimL family protein N-acetyltransferase